MIKSKNGQIGLRIHDAALRPLGMRPEFRMAPAFLAEAAGDPCILIEPFLSRVLGYDPAEA